MAEPADAEVHRCNAQPGQTIYCFKVGEGGDTFEVVNRGNTYSVKIVERKTDGTVGETDIPSFGTKTITFAPRSDVFVAHGNESQEANAVDFSYPAKIRMRCAFGAALIKSWWACGAGERYREHCFYGEAWGLEGVGGGVIWGDLNVDDRDQIFRKTNLFQYNKVAPYLNVNFFFDSLTNRLGHFHGGGIFASDTIGYGEGRWDADFSECIEDSVAPRRVRAHGRSPSRSSGSVGGGLRSPRKAIRGFVKGFNHDNPRKACRYVKPSLQNECRSVLKRFDTKGRVRHLKVVSSRRSDNRARVKVRGVGCQGARCRPLGGPGKRTVTVRCKRVDKRWYLR